MSGHGYCDPASWFARLTPVVRASWLSASFSCKASWTDQENTATLREKRAAGGLPAVDQAEGRQLAANFQAPPL